ncbi:MAG: Ku protein [Actinobacteria bacterium]|nr:Ku protein [Actinomycetota bacterium]
MPRAIWSGPISFGLVNIPIQLFPAIRSKSVSFRMLHEADNTPVNLVKTCPKDNKALSQDEIVKGYEFEKGRFVIMEDKDFEAARASIRKGRAIEIVRFVEADQVDPIYFQKSYYLAPEESSIKAYRLLLKAMANQKKAALVRFVLREKQHLALLRNVDSAFVLETLYYHDEVRAAADLPGMDEEIELAGDELELAEGLIDRMSGELDLEAQRDEYRDELLRIINQKIEGKEITVPELEPLAPVIDIMGALKESIARQEKGEAPARKRKRAS